MPTRVNVSSLDSLPAMCSVTLTSKVNQVDSREISTEERGCCRGKPEHEVHRPWEWVCGRCVEGSSPVD